VLNRQKILLLMLREAGRSVGRVELMKWCFLLRHESPSGGGGSFYDFVPYRYGPFSFSLYQEIGKLEEFSYVQSDGEQAWKLNPECEAPAAAVDASLKGDIKSIVSRCKRLSTNQLLDYVYSRYPEFTVNSERQRLANRARAEVAVYTAGYETLSVDRFLNMLVRNGVERLIDVRNNPVSRRYGFHKSTLARLCGRLAIEYVHFAELGIRTEVRREFEGPSGRELMFDRYERTTLVHEQASVLEVAHLLAERPSVLVCMEAEPVCCHRSRLAKPLSMMTGLPITHLRPEP